MNNIFDSVNQKDLTEIYDLKGSTYKRKVKEEELKKGFPMKDLDIMQNG